MFEKEAKEYADNYHCTDSVKVVLFNAFKSGAEYALEKGKAKVYKWIYMKDINLDEELDKYNGGKLYIWKVKIISDKGNVEFEGFHAGSWSDLIYEACAYQVKCFKKIKPPKELEV